MLPPVYIYLSTLHAISIASGANVLALFPIPLSSHFRVYLPLLERLVERGHQVDVLSHFPRESFLPGYRDLSVRGSVPFLTNIPDAFMKSLTLLETLEFNLQNCGPTLCEAMANTTAVKELVKSPQKYDLIITEIFIGDCLMGHANVFRAPIIGMTSTINYPWASDLIGLPDNPSYIPHIYSPYTTDMNFFERFYNAVSLLMLKSWYNYRALENNNEAIRRIFGKNDGHLRDTLRNISLLMVNSHFSIFQSRPMPPNFIEIGGIHIKFNLTLPKEYERYLQTNMQGVALVSFGTYIKSETFPEKYLTSLFEALKDIPYKILWKGNVSVIPKHLNVPENIEFVSWLPQAEVLCHPNLKFFITHCGIASVQEAVHCGKPILGIPIWFDQPVNANAAVSKGIGISIPIFELTKEKLSAALRTLINNTKYTNNARALSEVFRDRPLSALDTAVYWTEYVIRHGGAPHLRPKGADLPWYTYHCLDIIAIPCVIVLLLFIFVYKLFSSVSDKSRHHDAMKLSKTKLN